VAEGKICTVCGLEMMRLSSQIWTCKCGHTERGKPSGKAPVKRNEKGNQRRPRIGFWEERTGKVTNRTSPHRKEIVYRKKRTSSAG
jgi:hypothetical protein